MLPYHQRIVELNILVHVYPVDPYCITLFSPPTIVFPYQVVVIKLLVHHKILDQKLVIPISFIKLPAIKLPNTCNGALGDVIPPIPTYHHVLNIFVLSVVRDAPFQKGVAPSIPA
ncbi:MAG: hypothetical protein WCP92_05480 [bacterium]